MHQTVSLEHEINPWEAQAARFDFAARKLNLDDGLWKVLRYPSRELIVHFPVSMDDGSRSRSLPGSGCSIPLRAGRQREESATRPT